MRSELSFMEMEGEELAQLISIDENSIDAAAAAAAAAAFLDLHDLDLDDTTTTTLHLQPHLISAIQNIRTPIFFQISDDMWKSSPTLVSFGPIHYHQEKLEISTQYKDIYIERIREARKLDLRVYLHHLRGLMPQIRRYYYSKNAINGMGDQFMGMLVQDSCFIMELMLAKRDAVQKQQQKQQQQQQQMIEEEDNSWTDPIVCHQQLLALVKSDMLLAENQLPFFVLETLFSLLGTKPDCCSLAHLAVEFFADLLTPECCSQWQILSASSCSRKGSYYHLLHLFHSCATALTPSPPEHRVKVIEDDPKSQTLLIPSATDLADAGGVEFKRTNDGSFFKISFQQGVMEISPLLLTNTTTSLYRNLIAFEQHLFHKVEAPVTAYMTFLGRIIGSDKDLELLRQKEIIGCAMTEEKAYHFFKEQVKLASSEYRSYDIPGQLSAAAAVNNFVSITRKRRIAAIKFGFRLIMFTDLMLACSVLAQLNSAAAHKAVLLGLIPFQMLVAIFTAKNDRKGRYANVLLLHCVVSTSIALSYCNVL